MNPTAQLVADRVSPIRFSDSVTVTVTVTGTAPLRVELPAQLLTLESQDRWKIVPVAEPTTSVEGTRGVWVQRFRCEPYEHGEKVPLEFEKLRVTPGGWTDPIALAPTPNPLLFRVETALLGATAENARPATGVEALPPQPETSPMTAALWGIGGAALVIGLTALVTVLRRKRPVVVPLPWQVAHQEMDSAKTPPGLEVVARAIRVYLQRRFSLPSDTVTTAELVRLVESRLGDLASPLASILSVCDAARFSGVAESQEELDRVRNEAKSWIAQAEQQPDTTIRAE